MERRLYEANKSKDNYDLIVMDLIIPKMDGLSVLEELKKKYQ